MGESHRTPLAAILAADVAGYSTSSPTKQGHPAVQGVEEGRGGMVSVVNVKTDYRARATTVRFSSRETRAGSRRVT